MMLMNLLEGGTKELGVRFNLIGVLPSLMLALFITGLYWSGAPREAPNLALVYNKIEAIGVKEGMLLAIAILFFSLLLQPLQLSMVRILEGYWNFPLIPPVGAFFSRLGLSWHSDRRLKLEKRHDKLLHELRENEEPQSPPISEEEEALKSHRALQLETLIAETDWQLYRRYPTSERLLPTALGNALRAAEDASYDKYELDAAVIWPRMYPLFRERMLNLLADRRNQLDLAVRLCVVLLLSTIVSAVVLVRHGWWLVVPAVTLLLAWLSYRGAIAAAVVYGESIQVAFDLYRFDLFKAMRLPLASNLNEERTMNRMLSNFLRQGDDEGYNSVKYEAETNRDKEE